MAGNSDWCYACGRITAREDAVLPGRALVEALLSAKDVEASYGVLAQTEFKKTFDNAADVHDFDARLDEYYRREIADVAESSPDKSVAYFFTWPQGFVDLRDKLTEFARTGAEPPAVRETLRNAYETDPRLAGIQRVVTEDEFTRIPYDMAADSCRRGTALITGIDGIYLGALASLADKFKGSAGIQTFIRDFILSKIAEVMVRRLEGGASIAETAETLFRGKLATFLGDKVHARPTTAFGAVEAWAPAHVYAAVQGAFDENAPFDAEKYATLAEDLLTQRLLWARRTPFGIERAFAFLADLRIQMRNIRMAISAVVNDLDRAEIRERLRREYVE